MSIRLMAKCYELAVDSDTREILQALADHANDDGSGVRPSIARIAWKIGDGTKNERGEYKNARTVQRRIKTLIGMKALTLVRKAGYHRANEYLLDLSVFPLKAAFEASGDTYHVPENMGDKLTQKGDKLTQKGDNTVSPEPSIEPSLEPSYTARGAEPLPEGQTQSETPTGENPPDTPAEPPSEINYPPAGHLRERAARAAKVPTPDPLVPELAEEKYLFQKVNEERARNRYGPQKRFKTLAQKQEFRLSIQFFNGSTCAEIDHQLTLGKGQVDSIVNAINWRRKNWDMLQRQEAERKARANGQRAPQAPRRELRFRND